MFITTYLFFKTLFNIKSGLVFLNSINFDFLNVLDVNLYFIERLFFLFITNPVVIFLLFFIIVIGFYLFYAAKKIGKRSGIISGLALFFLFFAVLFGFWWVISIIYVSLNRKISWK